MEDGWEGAQALAMDETVLIVTDSGSEAGEERFIGVLTAVNDLFLSAKVSHEWKLTYPMVLPESAKKLRKILAKRPLGLLKAQVALKYRIIPRNMGRDDLVELLAEWMEQSALSEVDPVKAYIPLKMPKHISLAISDVRKLESLSDIVDNEVLKHLDFDPKI